VLDDKVDPNVFDGCVSEVGSVVGGVWVTFVGGSLFESTLVTGLGPTTPPTPTILPSLFIKSSYDGPASPLDRFGGWEVCWSRCPNSMSVSGLCVTLVECHDSFKGTLAGMRGLSEL